MKELWQPVHHYEKITPHGAFSMTVGDASVPGKDAPLLVRLRYVLTARITQANTFDGLYQKISDHCGVGDYGKPDMIAALRSLLGRYAIRNKNGYWRLKDVE